MILRALRQEKIICFFRLENYKQNSGLVLATLRVTVYTFTPYIYHSHYIAEM